MTFLWPPLSPRWRGFRLEKNLWAAALAVGLWAAASSAWGFSLGRMEVKSSFGEKFDAEIELKAVPDQPVSVTIGSPLDYQRMGVPRPSVVDELVVPGTLEVREGRQLIRVISPLPLFYPSFNLVVRAEQGGDILMENYLITVDFRQSVSLHIKAERSRDRQAKEKTPPATEPDTLGTAETAGPAPGGGAEEEASAPPPAAETGTSSPVVVAVHPAPLVVRELPEDDRRETEPLPTPPSVPMEETPPVTVPAPPAAPPPAKKPPKPQAAVARLPAPEKQAPASAEQAPSPKTKVPPKPPLVLSRETYGPLKKGESLASIISDLKLEKQDSEKVALALWMDNRDKFIKGNIHGLGAGVELNLTALEGRLQEIRPHQAHWLIQNHWQEWQVINDRLKLASQIEMDPELAQILMPTAQKEIQNALHQLVETWRATWEEGDLAGHLALFARTEPVPGKTRGFEYWKRFKTMMFRRHKKVQIKISPPLMVRMGERVLIGFEQWFDSNRMRSFGNKTLELVQVDRAWKVFNERFAVKKFFNKIRETGDESAPATEADFSMPESLAFPLVVHAATQLDTNGAVDVLNQLQTAGFDAYIAPLYVTPTKKIYRVLVGRLSDWDQAETLTRAVRGVSAARFAAPKRFPYTLKAGEFLERQQAQARAQELRALGVSSYLLSAGGGNFPNPVIQVLVGGFLEKQNAERYAAELGQRHIEVELVAP